MDKRKTSNSLRASMSKMADGVPELNVVIDEEDYHAGVCQVLKCVRPSWKEDEVKVKILEGGDVNFSLACYVSNPEDSVILRIFGSPSLLFFPQHIDRGREIRAVRLMNEAKLCVPILATFSNGYCMELAKGEPADNCSLGIGTVERYAMKELARYHCERTTRTTRHLASSMVPVIFEFCRLLIENTIDFNDPEVKEWFCVDPSRIRLQDIKNILHSLNELMRGSNMEVSFCHNDANCANTFVDRQSESVTFIDYESCEFNYSAYDLAYCLDSYHSYNKIDISRHLPSRDVVMKNLRYYLECRQQYGDNFELTEQLLAKWYHHYEIVSLTAHLWIGLVNLNFTKQCEEGQKRRMYRVFATNGIEIPANSTDATLQAMYKNCLSRFFMNRIDVIKQKLQHFMTNDMSVYN